MANTANLKALGTQLMTFADGAEATANEARQALAGAVNGQDPDPAVLLRLQQDFSKHEQTLVALLDTIKGIMPTITNRDERKLLLEAEKFLNQSRDGVRKVKLLLTALLPPDPNDP
jgi:hypothetical protein